MAISTGKFVAGLPGKAVTEGVDWMGILDAFDPTTLDQKYVDECARRNPFVTCYGWETPPEPIEGRLESSKTYQNFARRDLESCATTRTRRQERQIDFGTGVSRCSITGGFAEKSTLYFDLPLML